MVRVETEDQKIRERERRYWKNYRITIAHYNRIGEFQEWRCAICGRPASDFTVPLQVDHEHFKIEYSRGLSPFTFDGKGWTAQTVLRNQLVWMWGQTKEKAKALLLDKALPLSVRGLLCPGRYTGCNRLLGRVDKPLWLGSAKKYLEDCPAYKIIS